MDDEGEREEVKGGFSRARRRMSERARGREVRPRGRRSDSVKARRRKRAKGQFPELD